MFDALWWAAVAVGIVTMGLARIVAWWLDHRDYAGGRSAREAQVIDLARAELDATKRGDLLEAARLADLQEGNP